MSYVDKISYTLTKWRYQPIFGLKKILWLIIAITVLLTPIAYWTTNLAVKAATRPQFEDIVQQITIPHPELSIQYPSNPSTLSYENNKRGFYAAVTNKQDVNIGYNPWVYDYKILDASNRVVEEGTRSSYLLPNERTYVTGPITNAQGLTFEVETNLEKSVPVEFILENSDLTALPQIKVVNRSFNDLDNDEHVNINFSLSNDTLYDLNKIDAYFLLYNKDDRIIGIGRFKVESMPKGQIEEVNITFPKPSDGLGTINFLEVLPVVNYMDNENYSY